MIRFYIVFYKVQSALHVYSGMKHSGKFQYYGSLHWGKTTVVNPSNRITINISMHGHPWRRFALCGCFLVYR